LLAEKGRVIYQKGAEWARAFAVQSSSSGYISHVFIAIKSHANLFIRLLWLR
jgi:hypothetical protein